MPQTPELAARQAQSEVARLRADNAALRAQTQQLAAENDHLTRLLESAPESVLGMDRHGIVTDWNRGAQRILGWSAEEAIGQRLSGLIIPPKHRAAHEAGMQRYLQTGQSRVLNRLIEIEAQHKDGRLIWVELSIWAVEQDHNAGFGAFIRDVSERKQSQELLRDSEERYRSMVEHLDEGMLVIQDGRVVFGNTRASDILRVSPGALPQADFLQWLHPDDRALAGERQRRRQAGEQVPDRYELRLQDADGTVRWVETHVALADWGGRPATLSFFADVTERKAMMTALQRSEDRYRAVVEHVGQGMIVLQGEQIRFANSRATEILEMPLQELLAVNFLHRVHPDDHGIIRERRRRRLAGEDVPSRYEVRLLRPDGGIRWLELGVTVLPWEGEPATLTFFSDVTERKVLEDKLARGLEERETILESSVVGIAFVSPEQAVLWANRAMLQLLGLASDQTDKVLGEEVFLSPEQYRQVRAEAAACIDAGRAFDAELQLRRQDGTTIWVSLSGKATRLRDNFGTVWVLTDISQRKALEDQLTRTLDERETILQTSGVGIAFLTPQGQTHWANATMRHIFAVPEGLPIPTSTEPLYPSREAFLSTRAQVGACLARGEVFEAELQMRRQNGQLFWASVSCKAVDPRDASPATVWVITDVTRRKELEDALQKTSSEREAILNSALVGIVLSVGRAHQWVNARFAEMVGYSREELIGTPTRITHVSDAQWQATGVTARAALEATGTFAEERQLRRRNGELLWVQLAGQCVRGHDPDSGVIWTFLDISARRQAEEDTRAALARQQELNELRSRFVAMTSHEFRTPLATILSSSELLKYYSDRMPEAEKLEMLQAIEGAVQRMTRMLDRMLHMGKTEAQMLEFAPASLDLLALCRSLVEEACTQQGATPAQVTTDFSVTLAHARYDEKLLRHIFGNLLSNALKYSPNGAPVRFSVRTDDQQTVFEVADQGIGIPAAEIPHLFESFHRASNVGDIQGTGLGLAIVKSSVELHGGRIAVDSALGAGTRFTVHLPHA